MTGAQFRWTRHKLGLTAEQMAKRLGVTDRTIRNWERPAATKRDRVPPPAVVAVSMMLQQQREGE